MDDFNPPPLTNSTNIDTSNSSTLLTNLLTSIRAAPFPIIVTLALAPILVLVATRLSSEKPSERLKIEGKDGKTVWRPAYWVPGVGHAVSLYVLFHVSFRGRGRKERQQKERGQWDLIELKTNVIIDSLRNPEKLLTGLR